MTSLPLPTLRLLPRKVCLVDRSRFDDLVRSLSAARSRRDLARLLGGLGLGPALWSRPDDADARRCPPCRKKKRGKCKGKKRDGTPCPGGECRGGRCRPVSCFDGIRNGAETDVDCGGTCVVRCQEGRRCLSRSDCLTGYCPGGTCQECGTDGDCPNDLDGPCYCDRTAGGQKRCNKAGASATGASCAACFAGTNCVKVDVGRFNCYLPCGGFI